MNKIAKALGHIKIKGLSELIENLNNPEKNISHTQIKKVFLDLSKKNKNLSLKIQDYFKDATHVYYHIIKPAELLATKNRAFGYFYFAKDAFNKANEFKHTPGKYETTYILPNIDKAMANVVDFVKGKINFNPIFNDKEKKEIVAIMEAKDLASITDKRNALYEVIQRLESEDDKSVYARLINENKQSGGKGKSETAPETITNIQRLKSLVEELNQFLGMMLEAQTIALVSRANIAIASAEAGNPQELQPLQIEIDAEKEKVAEDKQQSGDVHNLYTKEYSAQLDRLSERVAEVTKNMGLNKADVDQVGEFKEKQRPGRA